MSRIYSFLSHKGGVSKTTTVFNTAAILSLLCEERVLAIDLDGQGNLSRTLGADPELPTIADVINGEVNILDAIQETPYCDLISADVELYNANYGEGDERGFELKKALDDLLEQTDYEYVLIDNGPGRSFLTYSSLIASDGVIVPVQADAYSLQGLYGLLETLDEVKELNPNLSIDGILLTMFDRRTLVGKQLKDLFKEESKELQMKLFSTPIRHSIKATESALVQKPLIEYAPKAAITQDYLNFVEELVLSRPEEKEDN